MKEMQSITVITYKAIKGALINIISILNMKLVRMEWTLRRAMLCDSEIPFLFFAYFSLSLLEVFKETSQHAVRVSFWKVWPEAAILSSVWFDAAGQRYTYLNLWET